MSMLIKHSMVYFPYTDEVHW